ncbi:hypothetical protein OSB04_023669 [Centaurea solstitialis]|uniref:Uncharacterized protein n=1 Tax=Centaurea solstitialis TaxID=347529 RepID=A0AA38W2H6_9ASTR|nr:hypothetical protein OSB04_023669 [Centaurea solstitialis]
MATSDDVQAALKPFLQRASEAECLVYASSSGGVWFLSSHGDSGNEELSKKVAEMQRMLEDAKAEKLAEREKASKEVKSVTEENAKLRYRITHLVRALKKADGDLASK